MQIATSSGYTPAKPARPHVQSSPNSEPARDSVTLNSSSSYLSPKGAISFGFLGTLPLVGFFSNSLIGLDAEEEHSTMGKATHAGAFANLAGTVTALHGLALGNHVATVVGLSLLGVSGLAGACAGLVAA